MEKTQDNLNITSKCQQLKLREENVLKSLESLKKIKNSQCLFISIAEDVQGRGLLISSFVIDFGFCLLKANEFF